MSLNHSTQRFALVLSCLAANSCMTTLPPLPSQGGPRWLQVESEHFILRTDQTERAALATSAHLERLLEAPQQLSSTTPGKLAIKLPVIVLEDFHQMALYFPPKTPDEPERQSVFITEQLFEPLTVTTRYVDPDSWRLLSHYFTHIVYSEAVGAMPAWLSEGLARYYQTAELDHGALVIGKVENHLLGPHRKWQPYTSLFDHDGRVHAAELLTIRDATQPPNVAASAWLLVDYLISKRKPELMAFLSALSRGESPRDSWAEALPDLPPERLDAALDRYVRDDDFPTTTQPLAARLPEPHVRALSDADIYTLRAELYAACDHCGAEQEHAVMDNLQLALKSEPSQLRAAAFLMLRSLRASQPTAAHVAHVAKARALARAHSESWLAWLVLAYAENQPGSGTHGCDADIVPKLRALAPEEPYALVEAAHCETRAGHARGALALSAHAVQVRPFDLYVLLYHAALLQALRRCDELAAVLKRVPGAGHNTIQPETLRKFEECQTNVRPPSHQE